MSDRTSSASSSAHRLVVEAGEGGHPDERALELADVLLHVGGDEFEDLVGHGDLLVLGLGLEDGESGLELGWLDLGDQPGEEPAAQTVLEGGDRLRRAVGGEDDLLGRAVEGVEGVEELLLEGLLALHELDVVDEQDVALPVAAFERRRRAVADGVHELVHVGLGGDVADVAAAEVLQDVVPDGVEEVGLAEPGVPVDEQRVVGTGRGLGHGLGGGVGEPVGRGDDEGLERVARDRGPVRPRFGPDRRHGSDTAGTGRTSSAPADGGLGRRSPPGRRAGPGPRGAR